ncbi:MAG: 30S ribosome-binding factor RbfA [Pyrinomonadaceae bacterium]|nr:30S ribosome-binding factor RbfA [Pyrinomonadaceae bacterium]MBP6214337.1 30S ribosome-binding factor RbfA [Pyrinomonadaceae bacterium]
MRRPEKFAEALREEIAEVVGFELNDPRVTSVTVTEVVVAGDLRDAKVFVFILGTDQEVNDALKTLRNASGFVRQQVAMNLNLRHAPHLHFVRDTAEENASRIGEILDDLQRKGEFDKEPESED